MTLFRSAASIVAAAALLALLGSRVLPPLALTERWLADFRIATLVPSEAPHDDIVVVAIDEETMRLFPYRSPVDRAFLATLLRALEAKGAKAIGIDLLFDQPTEPDKDAALTAALAAAQRPVVVAFAAEADGLTAEQAGWLRAFLPEGLRGHANLAKDPLDGTVRWVFPGRDGQPGMAAALAARVGRETQVAEGTEIRWRSPAAGLPHAFKVFPAHLAALLPAAWFADKIVLVGTDISLADRHRTPFSLTAGGDAGLMPGVLVHAQGLATLLDRRPSRSVSEAAGAALTLAAALLAALAFRLPWGLTVRLGLAGGLVAAGWIGAFALFRFHGLMVPVMTPTLAFALAAFALEVLGHRDAQQSRRFLKTAFAQYISPELVDQLVADPSMLSLSGEKREMTFLFTDVANFTSLAEGMDASTLTRVLNDYLDGVCAAAFAHGGTITDFIGDAVFATFGAPLPHPDHRQRAMACAREVAAFSRDYEIRMRAQGVPFSHTRIGVHSGTATVGNIGSTRRFKYAPVGDAVNTASRLEGLNKHFGTRICVSETTLLPELLSACRPIGRVVLKGRTVPLGVSELLDDSPESLVRAERYRHAYALLEADDPGAEGELAVLHAERPDDGLVAFHLGRARAGQRTPLIVMTEK
ncbi:MAG: adenylate/guanylate cyclase domain-containing protein [Magnetospirillum sp.]|nr:adenylate/guanylate cyclase domain-containing protein [Magnetospirillum sp.]